MTPRTDGISQRRTDHARSGCNVAAERRLHEGLHTTDSNGCRGHRRPGKPGRRTVPADRAVGQEGMSAHPHLAKLNLADQSSRRKDGISSRHRTALRADAPEHRWARPGRPSLEPRRFWRPKPVAIAVTRTSSPSESSITRQDHVRILVGGACDHLGSLVHLEEPRLAAAGDVQENSSPRRPTARGAHRQRPGRLAARFSRGDADAHERAVAHDRAHVGEVEVDDAGTVIRSGSPDAPAECRPRCGGS